MIPRNPMDFLNPPPSRLRKDKLQNEKGCVSFLLVGSLDATNNNEYERPKHSTLLTPFLAPVDSPVLHLRLTAKISRYTTNGNVKKEHNSRIAKTLSISRHVSTLYSINRSGLN
jgi:hypothetical protein